MSNKATRPAEEELDSDDDEEGRDDEDEADEEEADDDEELEDEDVGGAFVSEFCCATDTRSDVSDAKVALQYSS